MGNIANKISAKDKQLIDILSNNRFKIDMFQREYRWKREHIEALISDLYYSFVRNLKGHENMDDIDNFDYYYLGPIVLCEKGKNDVSIVDGQQRITSVSLLLIYMQHLQDSLGLDENNEHNFLDYLYIKKGGRTTLVIDVKSREKIMRSLIDSANTSEIYEQLQIEDESVNNIISRYEDISNLFPEQLKKNEVFPLFAEWLLNNVTMVEIRAFSTDNAYVIFETMNDRGLSLNPTEITKAYLLSKIENEDQADKMNTIWKDHIQGIKSAANDDSDMAFFRDWLRAKYAVSKRQKSANSQNEDFELIGSQYHTWIKNNDKTIIGLSQPKDYYMFIKSDFQYYSNLYQRIYKHRTCQYDNLSSLYVTSMYCMADSLYMPLMMSSITKLDDNDVAATKLEIVDHFIDRFINIRTLKGRTVTQSAIRDMVYDLIKDIRDCDTEQLSIKLNGYRQSELTDVDDSIFIHGLSTSYMHYFFARVEYYKQQEDMDFSSLMRSRKKNSYVLYQILKWSDFSEAELQDKEVYLQSLCNFCLVHRQDVDSINQIHRDCRIKKMKDMGYLSEMKDEEDTDDIGFWIARKDILKDYIYQIWIDVT